MRYIGLMLLLLTNMLYADFTKLNESLDNHELPISKEYALAVCYTESSFNARAISPTADFGICQIHDYTYYSMCESECFVGKLLEVNYNVKYMVKILRNHARHLRQLGLDSDNFNTYLIASYNLGVYRSYQLYKKGVVPTYYKRVLDSLDFLNNKKAITL